MKNYNIEDLGFSSWLELYQWLNGQEMLTDDRVTLVYAPEIGYDIVVTEVADITKLREQKHKEITLRTDYIRDRTITELSQPLPLKSSVEVIIDLLNNPEPSDADLLTVVNFLKKLKTRDK